MSGRSLGAYFVFGVAALLLVAGIAGATRYWFFWGQVAAFLTGMATVFVPVLNRSEIGSRLLVCAVVAFVVFGALGAVFRPNRGSAHSYEQCGSGPLAWEC